MARSRNIKPGLFKNEDLAECSIWARYLFPGLWCIADSAGRLEDRPKRIKGELLAFDSVDVEPLLGELAAHGFIARYEVAGQRIIQILTFGKHQNPHFRERPSELAPMPGWQEPEQITEKPEALGGSKVPKARGKPEATSPFQPTEAQGKPEAGPRLSTHESDLQRGSSPADSLFSDSLIPDSLSPQPPKGGRGARQPVAEPEGFVRFWAAWPPSKRKEARGKCAEAWVRDGLESFAEQIVQHVTAKRDSTDWAHDGGQFVEAPAVYLKQRRWEGAEVVKVNSAPPEHPEVTAMKARAAALPADWWRIAGFDSKWDAEASRCNWMNYTEFRNRERIPAEERAPA